MVKVKEHIPWSASDGSIDVEAWLQQLGHKGYALDLELVRNACNLSQLSCFDHATETGVTCLEQGLAMADMLADLGVDQETLMAAIVFVSVHYAELSIEDVEEQLGSPVAKLVIGIEKMSAIYNLQPLNKHRQQKHQLDNVRKMLLAMVDDVRVVLVKLAERLCVLRATMFLPQTMQHHIATEAMDIYAPLANRLGIGAIKWEMEDLAFRYLYPKEYTSIAKGLNIKRIERDKYVSFIVDELNKKIKATGALHFEVYGRAKHIHSIYRKMMRKNVILAEIYDATAVRILVDTKEQCYNVLGMVHELWQQVPAEFDDYIHHPKANGYQSLHTAVKGPDDLVFEVQIRTFNMHDLAEKGVAAHWKYKEGRHQPKQSYERKIEWLREVLAWHKDMASSQGISEAMEAEFLDDRVYVFTPDGDILDLPRGVTSLDFAYHVHSQIGHRCRGAKVNGAMVPLTYALKTGDKIEILTGNQARPSRDWLNPHLNYLKTTRAKAKVLHWFKMQDFDKNKDEGHNILDKELKNLGIKFEQLQDVVTSFNLKHLDDLLAALGRGDIKLNQILNRLSPVEKSIPDVKTITKPLHRLEVDHSDLNIEGIGNLLTTIARCCQPLPGDNIVGYITIGRGVSVHRQDCSNVIHASSKQHQRFIQVSWGHVTHSHYVVNLVIKAYDRPDLLREVTSLLASEKAQVSALQTKHNKRDNKVVIRLTVEIEGLNALSRLLTRFEQIPNILEARRELT